MSSTETTSQQVWRHKKFESRYGPASRFISPSGFIIELVGTSNIIRLLTKLAFSDTDEIQLTDGSRIAVRYKIIPKPERNIVVIDTEPWLNPDFKTGQVVGNTDGLTAALGHYLLEQAWAK